MKGIYKISGIYKIQSIVKPERIYIGSSSNMGKRWWSHLNDLKQNKHGNPKLQNHFNKYGFGDLQYSILLGCDKELLSINEQFFIDTYNPWFNICQIANSVLGRKCTDDTKRKMSLIHKGKKLSKEHKKNMSVARKGVNFNPPVSIETRKKMSESHKEHKTTIETKIKIGMANKGKVNAKKDIPLSYNTKEKMKMAWVIRKLKIS